MAHKLNKIVITRVAILAIPIVNFKTMLTHSILFPFSFTEPCIPP